VLPVTPSEQEYLKQIYLYTSGKAVIHTKQLAAQVKARSASVTDMVKRLAKKKLLVYNRYYGCSLSKLGKTEALKVIRRHRLWKLFLAEKLTIDWKEIHQIATWLQSIDSDTLVEKLSMFLGHPVLDPHGEPIPDIYGKFPDTGSLEILDLKINQPASVFGYRHSDKEFLQYVERLDLLINTKFQVISIIAYDHSLELLIEKKKKRIISKETAQKIYVRLLEKDED
jgi:DtxR family Mn-dependent transcriptional regulator